MAGSRHLSVMGRPKKNPLPANWQPLLTEELQKPYMQNLLKFLEEEKKQKHKIAPKDMFRALELVNLDDVKVVILGQDPYPTAGNANGLAFAVNEGVDRPASLRNIFKEVSEDLQVPMPEDNTLVGWAEQGVLLLNTVLTIRQGEAFSHRNKGWEEFTDRILRVLNLRKKGIVFLLWGGPAQSKRPLINTQNRPHKILTAAHPSPLSAYRGFLGCKHFSKANELLIQLGHDPINWSQTKGRDK